MECNHCHRTARSICKDCDEVQVILCNRHGSRHSGDFNHSVEIINEEIKYKILKAELKKCISNILNQSLQIINEIQKVTNKVINELNVLGSRVKNIKKLKNIGFDDETFSGLIENIKYLDMKKKKILLIQEVIFQVEFNDFTIKEKTEFIENNWPFMNVFTLVHDLLLSYDGKYLFQCSF
jgi:hypothetical protein